MNTEDRKFFFKHRPNNEVGQRWEIRNPNNETVAYTFCAEMAKLIVDGLHMQPEAANFNGIIE